VCGENFHGSPASSQIPGPSPRVRGEPPCHRQRRDRRTGHPRVCGENSPSEARALSQARAIPACAGRTRKEEVTRINKDRAIPACAGRTTTPKKQAAILSGPSPRVRGERPAQWLAAWQQSGPSPRVRGERPLTLQDAAAFLGHPRVCGENSLGNLGCLASARAIPACAGRTSVRSRASIASNGPSPRVRGEPITTAGKATGSAGHPRVCGENSGQQSAH